MALMFQQAELLDGPFSNTQQESNGVMSKILTAMLTIMHLFRTLDNAAFVDFWTSSKRKKDCLKRRTGSQRAQCNFTVVTVILDHYCSSITVPILRTFLFPPKVLLRGALVSQEQKKEPIHFPILCTMSISYSLFPRAWPCPRFMCCSWKNSSFVFLGQRMGWSWPRSKLQPTTYAIWSALGCALFTSLFHSGD